MPALAWDLPHGVRVALSLAHDGDLRVAEARSAWCAAHGIPPPAVVQQVHGSGIVPATEAHAGLPGDGLIDDRPQASLGVRGADCPPLVLAAPDALGAAHCGWRGTAAGIVPALIAAMAARSRHPPAAWTAWIGPGVHRDDFEVDAPVLRARRWPTGCILPGRPGRGWLDLPAAIAEDCRAGGITAIARCALATSRDPRLRSHRRNGPGFPLLAVAWRSTCGT